MTIPFVSGMIVAAKVLSMCFTDFGVLQISNVFAIYFGFLTAFAKSTIGIYLGKLEYLLLY